MISNKINDIELILMRAEEGVCRKAFSKLTHIEYSDHVYFYGSTELFNRTNFLQLVSGFLSIGISQSNQQLTGITIRKENLEQAATDLQSVISQLVSTTKAIKKH
jgi:hypothetical protein